MILNQGKLADGLVDDLLAAAAERKACAKIVEGSSLPDAYSEPVLLEIAAAIRSQS